MLGQLDIIVRITIMSSVVIWSLILALVQGQDNGNVFKPDPLRPGPWVHMSHGAVWPRPAQQSSWPNFFVLDPQSFKIQVKSNLHNLLKVIIMKL